MKSIKLFMIIDSIEKSEHTYYEKKTNIINEYVNEYLKYLDKANSKK